MLKLVGCDRQEAADQNVDVYVFNRRRGDRQAVKIDAVCSVMTPSGTTAIAGVTITDASRQGMGMQSPMPAEVGSILEFHSADGRLPSWICRVARCEPGQGESYQVGLIAERQAAA